MDIQFGDIEVEEHVQQGMANLAIHNNEEVNVPLENDRVQNPVPRALNVHQNGLHVKAADRQFNNRDNDVRSNNADDDGRSIRTYQRGVRVGRNRRRMNPYDMGLRNMAFVFANMVSAQTGIIRQQLREARDDKEEDS